MNNKTYSDYGNTVVDAVEILIDRAVEQAQFDKTITASILETVDSNKGKYKIKYQDSSFYAFAEDVSKVYTKGTEVYILIPGNDFSKTKKILGSVKDLVNDWKILSDSIDRYEDVGVNIISLNPESEKEEWGISSYKKDDSIKISDDLIFKIDELKNYLSKSTLMKVSAEFSTEINNNHLIDSLYNKEEDKDIPPTFGLKIKIGKSEEDFKEYVLDTSNMSGTPYSFLNYTQQKAYFEIDENFINDKDSKILSIELFQKGFLEDKDKISLKDIFVKNISFKGVKEISLEKYNTYSLRISYPYGDTIYKKSDTLSLIANIVLKNNISSLENTKFYWGKEDIFVNQTHVKYNKYLGSGWSFLGNEKELKLTGETVPVSTKFKCVAVYEETNVLEDEILIRVPSMDGQPNSEIKINSSAGQYFYNGEGNTKLTVETSNLIAPLSYQWVKIDNLKNTVYLSNEESIEVSAKDINRSVVYKCGVKDANDVVQGTASLEIYNLTRADNKNISLYNGNQTFLYDLTGKSPCLEGNAVKQVILPLSFDYYDDTGKKVSKNRLSISWKIPKKNSMLKGFLAEKEVQEGDENYYILNTHDENVSFVIQDFYSANYLDNDIILEVVNEETSDKKSVVTTNFTFLKQGESGTNGTNIYGVIDLKIDDENGVHSILSDYAYPTLEIFEVGNHVTLNNYPLVNNPYFEASLYQNGEALSDYEVEWSIVKDVKDSNSNVSGYFTFLNKNGNTTQIKNVNVEEEKNNSDNKKTYDNHVLRATITKDDKDYFVEIPIVISLIKNTDEYLKTGFKIKENSGFNKVMYAADGTCPQYSMTPFEYEIKDGYEIVVSPYHGASTGNEKLFSVTESDDDKKKKMFSVFATSYYYGTTNDSGIKIDIYKKEDIIIKENKIAEILFPIYLYLNKFGYSALNGWDGNSIQINEDENYILSPQIGAGRKNKVKNTFTGLLMGEMTNKEKDNDIGLLGFSEGVRTIFLDAQTGKAVFGSEGKGQIILDPYSEEDAIIKSGGYEDRIVSKDENGDDVIKEGDEGSGMKINLSEPYIKWGNENFSVNKDGLLKCINATVGGKIESDEGHIGGWSLSSQNLYGKVGTVIEQSIEIPKKIKIEEEIEEEIIKTSYTCHTSIDNYEKDVVYSLTENEYENYKIYFDSEPNKDEDGNPVIVKEIVKTVVEKTVVENMLVPGEPKIDESTQNYISLQTVFGQHRNEVLRKEIFTIGAKQVLEEWYQCVYAVENDNGEIIKEFKIPEEGLSFKNESYYWLSRKEIDLLKEKLGNEKFEESFKLIYDENEKPYQRNSLDNSAGKAFLYSNGEFQGVKFTINTKSNSEEPVLEMTRDNKNLMKIYHRSKTSQYGIGFGIKEEDMPYKGVFSIGLKSVDPYEDLGRDLGAVQCRWKKTYTYHLESFGDTFIGKSLKMKDPEYGTSVDSTKKKYRPVLQLESSPETRGVNNSYYGSDLLIGAGARTILGSGESHNSIYNAYFKNSKTLGEGLFLTADSDMRFYINCNTIKNSRYLELYYYGGNEKEGLPAGPLLKPDKNKEAYLGHASYRWKGVYTDYLNASGSIIVGNVKEGFGSITVGKSITVGGATVATQTWVEGKGYATQTWVEGKIPTNVPSGNIATQDWVDDNYASKGFNNSDWTQLNNKIVALAERVTKLENS